MSTNHELTDAQVGALNGWWASGEPHEAPDSDALDVVVGRLLAESRSEAAALREQLGLIRRLVRLPETDQYRDEACRHVAQQPYADNRYVRLLDEVRALTTGDDG